MKRVGNWLKGIPVVWRKFFAWMAIALVLGAVAVVMTMQITHVDGRSPLDILNSRIGDENESATFTEPFHGQFISVLTTGDVAYPDPVDIRYYTRSFGAMDAGPKSLASMQFTIVENQAVKLIFSHLKESADLPHCLSSQPPVDARTVEPMKDGKAYWINPRMIKAGKRRYAEMTFPASPEAVTVVCGVVPDVLRQTFTARSMRFSFFTPGDLLHMDAASAAYREIFPDPKSVYKDYVPVSEVPVTVSLTGVEGLSFEGGRPNVGSDEYDSSRVIKSWGWTEISWEETSRKQQRDILLILIGTIIAIAVTALIEAIRPFIDLGVENKQPEPDERPYRRRERPETRRRKVRPF